MKTREYYWLLSLIPIVWFLLCCLSNGIAEYQAGNLEEDELRKTEDNTMKVHLRIIVVKNQSDANKIISRLEKGESFDGLAREKSSHPSREKGGDIGEVFLSDLREEFRAALKGVEQDRYTNVIQAGSEYVILYLVKSLLVTEIDPKTDRLFYKGMSNCWNTNTKVEVSFIYDSATSTINDFCLNHAGSGLVSCILKIRHAKVIAWQDRCG